MAGDWIKIEHALPEKPEVDRLADLLSIEPDAVVGKLVRLWSWADQHSLDGNGVSVTEKSIDRRVSHSGFAAALRKVGWLEGRDNALSFPNFSRHNGQTAKSRAVTNRRVAEYRNAHVTGPPLQKALPEKRREEEEPPTPDVSADLVASLKARDLHESFLASTGETVPFNGIRVRMWGDFIRAGFTEEDMKRVLHYVRRNQKPDGPYRPESVLFRNLIGDVDKFREKLQLAKGTLNGTTEPAAKLPSAADYGIK